MDLSQMLREIHQEPTAAARTIEALLPVRPAIVELARGRRHVLLSARGSSNNAAHYGRYLLEIHARRPAAMINQSVYTHYAADLDLADTLVVTVSQSGRTRELVETQELVRERGAATLAVTNVADSPLAAQADLALITQAGPELAIPATKTYLCETIAMAVLATALGHDPEAADHHLRRVPELIAETIGAEDGIDEAACRLVDAPGPTFVTSRGIMLCTALETAHKIEQTCLRPVISNSYADLRHGPIAVVRPGGVAVLLSAADGPMVRPMTDIAARFEDKGVATVGIGGDDGFRRACSVHVPAPDLPELMAPIGTVVPAQLVVERLAARVGLDPDRPRGLVKVTETEVGPPPA